MPAPDRRFGRACTTGARDSRCLQSEDPPWTDRQGGLGSRAPDVRDRDLRRPRRTAPRRPRRSSPDAPHMPACASPACGWRSTWRWRSASPSSCSWSPAADAAASSSPAGSTEYSLSRRQPVRLRHHHGPVRGAAEYQQKVLLVGIILALVLRGVFIVARRGGHRAFSWVFYLFGAFLRLHRRSSCSAARRARTRSTTRTPSSGWPRRVLPITDALRRRQAAHRVDGRRLFTPMMIVLLAIGSTDVLFALDSIPAIFGLTQEPFIVFTANALRADGPAPAVLPARRPARPAGLPVAWAWR